MSLHDLDWMAEDHDPSRFNYGYVGVGSRTTPEPILDWMTQAAARLERFGLILKSGGCSGADLAFEAGVSDPARKQIFRPNDATEEDLRLAAAQHPAWHRCSEFAKRLLARDVRLFTAGAKVAFVICWMPPKSKVGGTRFTVSVAQNYGIQVCNVAIEEQRRAIDEAIQKTEEAAKNFQDSLVEKHLNPKKDQ